MFQNSDKFEKSEVRQSAKRLDFESMSDSSFEKPLLLPVKSTESSIPAKVEEHKDSQYDSEHALRH